jgi:hypothetical protein
MHAIVATVTRFFSRSSGRSAAFAGLMMLAAGLATSQTDCARHQRAMRAMRAAFDAAPLPPGVAREETVASMGILSGNGNHCDFVVAARVRTRLAPADLAARLRAQRLRVRFDSGLAELPLWVVPGEDDLAREVLPPAWAIPGAADGGRAVVFAFWGGEAPGSDIRCH